MKPLNIIQNNEEVNNQINKKKQKTLLHHIEHIIECAEKSKLSAEFYQKTKTSINFVAKAMNLTANQAILFSLFVEKNDDYHIRINELSKYLGCRNIKMICMMSDIDELEKRRLIRCCRARDKIEYRVPLSVINAVKQNLAYKPEQTQNLNTHQLFTQIELLFDEREDEEITRKSLIEELRVLLRDNASLAFCKQIKEYNLEYYDEDFLLLLFFCHQFINLDNDMVDFHDMENILERKSELKYLKSCLQQGNNMLIEEKIIECYNDNGFEDKENFRITKTAKEKLFAELDINLKRTENRKGLILHKNIVSKPLFYDEREQSQIAQLTSLLHQKNFVSVQENLVKNGMRKGFVSLFYGAPGTGKTETVYQIAVATGRDIMQVDISDTKSCWFGESEKKIKAVFEKYQTFVKNNEIAPILLFNEADAVIGKRKENTTGNVVQTENAIQNIILQEMENLEGIMIATTNLTQNLDKAFERRFLYKIKFNNPNQYAKEKIWQTMLPSLTQEKLTELAKNYNFSGGQIENIARKFTVDTIINGNEPSLETIHSYCKTEFLYQEEGRKIGFNRE